MGLKGVYRSINTFNALEKHMTGDLISTFYLFFLFEDNTVKSYGSSNKTPESPSSAIWNNAVGNLVESSSPAYIVDLYAYLSKNNIRYTIHQIDSQTCEIINVETGTSRMYEKVSDL